MSDYIPKNQSRTNPYLFSDESQGFIQSTQQATNNPNLSDFFRPNDDDRSYNEPPSPIATLDDQSIYKVHDLDYPIGNKQVGIVNPSRPTSASKDEALIENSRSNILSIISLLNEYVISHPFMVVRRQAQVNNRSQAYHLTPFTVIPFMLRLQNKQGISTFFKGLPTILINHVLLVGSESFIYNLLQFPIEFDFGSMASLLSLRFVKHLALKSLAILIVTPFYCSSSIEMVQSWIVGESPYPLEHIKEGLLRIVHFRKDRKLPIYRLVGPSILYHLCYYVLHSLIRQAILRYYFDGDGDIDIQKKLKLKTVPSEYQLQQSQIYDESYPSHLVMTDTIQLKKISDNTLMNELKSSFYAHILTDIIMYPFQNILYRLFLQGTRTLIDNVDGRTAVIPLITNYDSATDCYQSIIQQEGTSGLFKGFGALILQYTVQASIIHLTTYCIDMILNN